MKTNIITLLLLLFWSQVNAQSVVGFWQVKSVKVGEESMTPVAKWFRNNPDGTFQSGNGWSQNSYGSWTYDQTNNAFTPETKNGIKDEFGAFKVSFLENQMIWKRQEEGMNVVVTLIPISQLPMAPADEIQGLWQLISVRKGQEDLLPSYDSKQNQFIFIRPDRRYRIRTPTGDFDQGFWYMNGHRPELTLINYDREVGNQAFSVEIKNDQLTMRDQASEGMIFTYNRINEFPEFKN